jgi:hypothetical protein
MEKAIDTLYEYFGYINQLLKNPLSVTIYWQRDQGIHIELDIKIVKLLLLNPTTTTTTTIYPPPIYAKRQETTLTLRFHPYPKNRTH